GGDRRGWRLRPLSDVVLRGFVDEPRRIERRDDIAVRDDVEHTITRDLADADTVQLPATEDALDVALAARPGHDEHPFLRLGEHHLVRRHRLRPPRHKVEVDAHADTALCGDLTGRARKTRGAEILYGFDRVGFDELERRLHEQLLEERVADLHRWPLRVVARTELEGGEQRRAGDTVATCIGA